MLRYFYWGMLEDDKIVSGKYILTESLGHSNDTSLRGFFLEGSVFISSI